MFSWYMRMGLFGKVLLPFLVLLPVGLGLPIYYVFNKTRSNTVESVVRSAKMQIDQFKILRGYYTKNVVGKVKSAGAMKIDYNHHSKSDTIPLPATFIHDLSKEFDDQNAGTKLRLYSNFPFPNRRDRKLDDFQKKAIEHLIKNPQDQYVETFMENGKEHVRVGVADLMVAEGCVSCHNSHPETPYNQWKLGDVRGILEVEIPIADDIKASTAMMTTVVGFSGGVGAVILCVLVLVMVFFVSRPLKRATQSLLSMKGTADETLEASGDLNQASSEVASLVTEQASAIQETVATLDEINAMVSRGVEGAAQTTELARSSHQVAKQGKDAVQQMVGAMEDINKSNATIIGEIDQSNQRISEIISVITEIADKTKVINDIVFQTKLLSFNASVEAARAGEHGKGFAVVAEEVGNLAQMSGNAAKEIAEMLGSSIDKVENIVDETKGNVARMVESGKSKVDAGVVIAKRCGDILDQVVDNVTQVNDMMGEITTAAKEQAEGISNISTAMNQLDSATHQNAAVAEKTSRYSDQLAREARKLKDAILALEADLLGANQSVGRDDADEDDREDEDQYQPTSRGEKVVAIGKPSSPSGSKTVPRKTTTGSKHVGASPAATRKASGSDFVPDEDDPNFEDV